MLDLLESAPTLDL